MGCLICGSLKKLILLDFAAAGAVSHTRTRVQIFKWSDIAHSAHAPTISQSKNHSSVRTEAYESGFFDSGAFRLIC